MIKLIVKLLVVIIVFIVDVFIVTPLLFVWDFRWEKPLSFQRYDYWSKTTYHRIWNNLN